MSFAEINFKTNRNIDSSEQPGIPHSLSTQLNLQITLALHKNLHDLFYVTTDFDKSFSLIQPSL